MAKSTARLQVVPDPGSTFPAPSATLQRLAASTRSAVAIGIELEGLTEPVRRLQQRVGEYENAQSIVDSLARACELSITPRGARSPDAVFLAEEGRKHGDSTLAAGWYAAAGALITGPHADEDTAIVALIKLGLDRFRGSPSKAA